MKRRLMGDDKKSCMFRLGEVYTRAAGAGEVGFQQSKIVLDAMEAAQALASGSFTCSAQCCEVLKSILAKVEKDTDVGRAYQ